MTDAETRSTLDDMSQSNHTFRGIIQAELDRRGWSAYRLVKECPDVPARTIYDFLSGNHRIRADRLEFICKALRLTLVADRRRRIKGSE